MFLLNPVYAIIVPFLFIFTIPIAIFASITTALAFSVLFFRVLLVYCELAFAVIPYYVLGLGHHLPSSTNPTQKALAQSRTTSSPPARRRKRRSNSSSSNLSIKSAGSGAVTPTRLSDIALNFPLSQSVGPTRDFEGVGGWRLDNRSDDEEDAMWTGMNSRLELPADHVRRHHRSHTGEGFTTSRGFGGGGGGRSYSPENVMNTSRSRARTPTGVVMAMGMEGYLAQPISPNSGKMVRAGRTASGSSGSSKGSSERMLSMKQR